MVKRSAESSNIEEELSNKPEQIHLAYGETPSDMVVMWSTGLAGLTEVRYGLLENNLNMSMTGEHVIFTERNSEGVKFVHRVKLAVSLW